ncbi:conserved domain protein [Borreliella spielmanii A14S]|uniref:Conserved domain protein n=1 Tax=Borreliella spielmanii A14S TaxID=498742 RepID=B9X8T1_9SPIR|nr:conserved domain protein [Borreliella spielmanii A14S]
MIFIFGIFSISCFSRNGIEIGLSKIKISMLVDSIFNDKSLNSRIIRLYFV